MTTATAQSKMTLPAAGEVKAAVQGQRALAAYLATQFETQHIQIFDDHKQAHQVELPTSALRLLVDILAELADGNAVKVVPVHAELTTQEAADLLNVSRPHFVKLLEDGVLAFHRTGKHRRVRFADLMQYKEARERASEQAMAELRSAVARSWEWDTNEAFPIHRRLRRVAVLYRRATGGIS
ncbi:DNA binding domain, excisionase family protein [Pseudomonas aeruginosa]|nr:DNA binding domain, excisionase family protein [Pseudomonas aeruginosa]